jgi:Septum formation
MAIAGFVLGLVGAILLSVGFSIAALRQIPKRNQRGQAFAIAGLVLSVMWVLAGGVVLLVKLTPNGQFSSGPVTPPGQVDIFSLRVGGCFQNPAGNTLNVSHVTAVPCTTPHNAQVFAQFKATEASYPGQQAIIREADNGCQARVSSSLDRSKLTNTMSLRVLFPESTSWADGQRYISCLVVDSTADLTSSLLAAGG